MRFNRSSNPVIRRATSETYVTDNPVTYTNVSFKVLSLLLILFASAFLTINYASNLTYGQLIGLLIGSVIVGFISVIVGTRSMNLAPYFAALYALCEGVVLAVISAIYTIAFGDMIVPTALLTTGIVFLIMLILYTTRVIKVTQRFASILVVALISVIFMSLLTFILPAGFGGGMYYLIVIVASILSAFFLLLDFNAIETCVERGTDSRVGWMLSLGLLVTLVWIYIEMLRLLAILSRRR